MKATIEQQKADRLGQIEASHRDASAYAQDLVNRCNAEEAQARAAKHRRKNEMQRTFAQDLKAIIAEKHVLAATECHSASTLADNAKQFQERHDQLSAQRKAVIIQDRADHSERIERAARMKQELDMARTAQRMAFLDRHTQHQPTVINGVSSSNAHEKSLAAEAVIIRAQQESFARKRAAAAQCIDEERRVQREKEVQSYQAYVAGERRKAEQRNIVARDLRHFHELQIRQRRAVMAAAKEENDRQDREILAQLKHEDELVVAYEKMLFGGDSHSAEEVSRHAS